MAKKKAETGVMLSLSYFVLAIVTGIVISLAHSIFPESVELGTVSLSNGWSLIHSAGTIALFCTLAIPFFHLYEERRGTMLSSTEWTVGYLIINFVAIYLVTRFAEQFGMGVTSWLVVLILAAVTDVLQGAAMMWLESIRPKLGL